MIKKIPQLFQIALSVLIICAIFSSNSYCQWQLATNTSFATSFASVNGILFSGKNGVTKSTDNGSTWAWAGDGFPAFNTINTLYSRGTTIFAGLPSNSVYITTNNGANWVQSSAGMGNSRTVNFITGDSLNLYAATTDGLFKSTDNAQSWTASGLDMSNVISLLVKNNFVFATIILDGVRVSTNYGATWSNASTGLPGFITINCLESKGTAVFCGTSNGGVFKTTNNGTNWVSSGTGVPTNQHTIYSIRTIGNTILFGSTYGVYSSTNNGSSWTEFNDGITSGTQVNNNDLFVYNNFAYVGANNGIYRRPVSQISDVKIISSAIRSFGLSQNYPNPFNPATVIRYSIPASSFVSLNVYDITGKFITNLTDQRLSAGTYEVSFRSEELPSGVYYYRLTAGDYSVVKQMMVVK